MAMRSGFYPFWFWNGELSADEIAWQVEQMAAQGIRGFFIHPRQGLDRPYLSESFFAMVEAAIAAAEKHGLSVHLYDEYPYPSGVAGGEVILGRPEFHGTSLVQTRQRVQGGRVRLELPRGDVLSAVAYPLDGEETRWSEPTDLTASIGMHLSLSTYHEQGLTAYNAKRFLACEPTPVLDVDLPDRPHLIVTSVQVRTDGHKYWGNYVDIFNERAIRRFLELTHGRYAQRLGEKFGRSVLSIYCDEIGVFWSYAPEWSTQLPRLFEQSYGYSLLEHLPALACLEHPEHLRVSRDLYWLELERFVQVFEQPVREWCRRHRIWYTGEKPSLRFSQLRYMDIPGSDAGHHKAGAELDLFEPELRWNTKAAASAGYVYGKFGGLTECYHSLGWGATLQDAKWLADGLVLAGISYLVPHGFFYTTHGLAKHDAPPSFFFQMPYWPFFGGLSRRLDRVFSLIEGTHVEAKVLVIEPSSGLPDRGQREAFGRLGKALLARHVDFLVVDTDVLAASHIEGSRCCVREVRGEVVVMPPMAFVEESLAAWLEEFEAAGGSVVRFEAGQVDEVATRLAERIGPSLSICGEDGVEAKPVYSVTRASSSMRRWFVQNTSTEAREVVLEAGSEIREIPLDEHLPAMLERRGSNFVRRLAPFESVMLEQGAFEEGERRAVIAVRGDGPAEVEARNRNLLRMYTWRMSLLDDSGQATWTGETPAMPLINQLHKSGAPFAPKIADRFGSPPTLSLPRLALRYEFEFGCAFDGPVALVMEPGSIVGEWSIGVNGSARLTEADFQPSGAHVRGSLEVDLTPHLQPGTNRIVVGVTTDRTDGGLLNALYLAGGFGVELEPLRLVSRPERGQFEDYEGNRLPFYAGAVEYTSHFDLDRVPDEAETVIELLYEKPFREASEVSINGGEFVPVLWEPRRMVIPTSRLRTGRNVLHTRVHTTLIRSFEGQWFDDERHVTRPVGDRT